MLSLSHRDYKSIQAVAKSLDVDSSQVENIVRSYKIHLQRSLVMEMNGASYVPSSIELPDYLKFMHLNEFSKIHIWGQSGTYKTKIAMNLSGYLSKKGYFVLYQSTGQAISTDVTSNLKEDISDVVFIFDSEINTIFKYADDVDVVVVDDVASYNQVSAVTELLKMNKVVIMLDQVRDIIGQDRSTDNPWFFRRPSNRIIYENIEYSFQLMKKDESTVAIRNMKDSLSANQDRISILESKHLFQ